MVVSFGKTKKRDSVSCDGPTKISKPRRLDAMEYAGDVRAGLINACQYSLKRRRGECRRSYDQRPTRRRDRHEGLGPKANAAVAPASPDATKGQCGERPDADAC